MDRDGALVSAREAAVKFAAAHPEVHFAVAQAGDKADFKLDFTTDTQKVTNAINGIGPTKGSSVWSAVTLAGAALKEHKDWQPNILLMVGDDDNVQPQNAAVGKTAVHSSGAA